MWLVGKTAELFLQEVILKAVFWLIFSSKKALRFPGIVTGRWN